MSSYIEIWCDGSYRPKSATLGVGWVQADTNRPFFPKEHYKILPPLDGGHNHGSAIAEFYAFSSALESVASGSKVQIYMDCYEAVDWLLKEEIGSRRKRGEPEVVKAFETAVRAKKRMNQVLITWTSDRAHKNMSLAHSLSRKASRPVSTI